MMEGKPVADLWYAIEAYGNGTVRLCEPWLDPFIAGNLWLIRGSERNLLIDTGTGIVSPKRVVDAIATKPVFALSCNSFFDHAGGLHDFEVRACSRLEAERITIPTPETSFTGYLRDDALSALPCPNYDAASYRPIGTEPTVLLNDGDTIELGDRQFEVIHLPGATPGSIVIWDPHTRSLFTSDTLVDDPLDRGAFVEDPDVYAQHVQRLRDLPVETVYPGHYRPFGRRRMHEIIDDILRRGAIRLVNPE